MKSTLTLERLFLYSARGIYPAYRLDTPSEDGLCWVLLHDGYQWTTQRVESHKLHATLAGAHQAAVSEAAQDITDRIAHLDDRAREAASWD